MSITAKKSTIALTASAALTAGLALSPVIASAEANPFATTELSSGYMQLAQADTSTDKKADAKKAEAVCGATKVDKAFLEDNPSYKAAMGK